MEKQSGNKIKLGLFVLTAVALFILGLYYIGSKKNIFHSTITVRALFDDVSGLIPGNNVRFNGINIGTVSKVSALSDTSVMVDFTIEDNLTQFITINSVISIGTDGLLGNKLVNIAPGDKNGKPVVEGHVFNSLRALNMDDALRTLTKTSANLQDITVDLKSITKKINNSNSLWSLFSDTAVAANVRSAFVNIRLTSQQTAILTGNLKEITMDIKKGKGSLGALIVDTSLYAKLKQVVVKFEKISDTTALVSGNLQQLTRDMKEGRGAVGMLLKDTTLVHNLNQSMVNAREGTKGFNENMEALKHNILFRGYFRKQEKVKTKTK